MVEVLKRAFDVVVAGAGLAATAPLLGALAVAIKLDSPGPVLFSQTRIGKGRRPFRTLKLRTMTAGPPGGAQITASGDRRITRVGQLLRRTKLDELPQLWNVLRGEMSLVGPRPEVPDYVATYRPEWEPLFEVRPGLTDPASIAFRDEEGLLAAAADRDRAYREVIMPLKLGLALEGVAQRSLIADLGVIARTVAALVTGPSSEDRAVIGDARDRIEALNREHQP